MGIVGMAMLPIFTTLSSANRGAADVEDQAFAVGLATEALEWSRAIGFEGWTRAFIDGGTRLKLPGQIKVETGKGRITATEDKVTSFPDDAGESIEYPKSSTRYRRELVMTFVEDSDGVVRIIRGETTVSWNLNVRGSPERRVRMEQMLHGKVR